MRKQGTVGAEVLRKVLCPTSARSAGKGGNLENNWLQGEEAVQVHIKSS